MKYVILTPAIGDVGGAQIYCRNKLKYCIKQGFDSYVFFDKKRNIYIEDLIPYRDKLIKEMAYFPYYYTQKKREKVIEQILKVINYREKDEVIIESHSFSESMWGELLAKRCHGRNMVFLLSETFEGVNEQALSFFEFKYKRKELVCINELVMQRLFKNYMPLKMEDCYALNAECTNSVEDVSIQAEFNVIGKYKVIGIIGRLQKPYVEVAMTGIDKLLKRHKDEIFQIVVIGGSPNKSDEKRLRNIVRDNTNMDIYITGNIYPIPQKLIRRMNVCIGAAGCVSVSRRENVPTISVDSVLGKAMGVVGYNTTSTIVSTKEDILKPVEEYLEDIFYRDFIKKNEYTPLPQLDNRTMNNYFVEHFEFMKLFDKNKHYFTFYHMRKSPKEITKKIICSVAGASGMNILTSMLSFFVRIMRR